MTNDWNALPDAVVMSGSINQFNARLGRWWKNDSILYRNIRSPQVTKHSAIAIYNVREGQTALLKPFNRPLSRRLDRCDRVIHNESGDPNGGNMCSFSGATCTSRVRHNADYVHYAKIRFDL